MTVNEFCCEIDFDNLNFNISNMNYSNLHCFIDKIFSLCYNILVINNYNKRKTYLERNFIYVCTASFYTTL